jgi:hypothetical protein
VEGINPGDPVEQFVSITPEGQPAVMSRTGAAEIYSLHWPQRNELFFPLSSASLLLIAGTVAMHCL